MTVTATRPPKTMKRLKTYDKGRVCTHVSSRGEVCTTILSITNPSKSELCYTHQPRKIPRVRGTAVGSDSYIPLNVIERS